MLDAFTGPEIAAAARVSPVTLAKYLGQGVVWPSQSGEGSAHEWSFIDLVAVASFGTLRRSPASLGTLTAWYEAWHQPEAERLVAAAVAAAAAGTTSPTPMFVVVADDGRAAVETQTDLVVLAEKYGRRM